MKISIARPGKPLDGNVLETGQAEQCAVQAPRLKVVATDRPFPRFSDPDAVHPALSKVIDDDGKILSYRQACTRNGITPRSGLSKKPSRAMIEHLDAASPKRNLSHFLPVREDCDRLLATPKSMGPARSFFGNGISKGEPGHEPGTAELSAQTRAVRDVLTTDYPITTLITSSAYHDIERKGSCEKSYTPSGRETVSVIYLRNQAMIHDCGTATVENIAAHEATHAVDAVLEQEGLRGHAPRRGAPDPFNKNSSESHACYTQHSLDHALATATGRPHAETLYRRRYEDPSIASYTPKDFNTVEAKSPRTQSGVVAYHSAVADAVSKKRPLTFAQKKAAAESFTTFNPWKRKRSETPPRSD